MNNDEVAALIRERDTIIRTNMESRRSLCKLNDDLEAEVKRLRAVLTDQRDQIQTAETQAHNHAEAAILLERAVKRVLALCDSWVVPPRRGMYVGVITDYRAAVDQCQRAVRAALNGDQ